MLMQTGIVSSEDLNRITPSNERLNKGPVAIIECFQKIPCNPCTTACPQKAIEIINDINNIPKLDDEKCNGCAMCVSKCPGLAIFVVDATYSNNEALVKIPWEFLPLPKVGDLVTTLNRGGEAVGKGKVIGVQEGKIYDRTRILHIVVPKSDMMNVRSIDRGSY